MDRVLTGAVLIALLAQPSCSGYFWGNRGSQNLPPHLDKPEFEETETEVIVNVGSTAFMPCRVRNIGDRMVSWIRTKDLHILTAGPHTFTSDVRFSSAGARFPGSSNWGLQLRNSQPSDAGTYECQVNTEPKLNRKIHLEIDENLKDSPHSMTMEALDEMVRDISQSGPTTKILGQDEQFVQVGSTVTLTCLVLPINAKAFTVDWLKDSRQVSFQASRGGISVVTDRSETKTTSSLTIADVTQEDSGNYTCRPQRGPTHSIQLLVLEGETTGAMQRESNKSPARVDPLISIFLAQTIIFTFF